MSVAVSFLGSFEKTVLREVTAPQADGLICGNLLRDWIREIGHILYSNSGDWVQSCSALAENHVGMGITKE